VTARKPGAPMPPSLRALISTAVAHPARSVTCPHCKAQPGKPCVLRTNGRLLPEPHPRRVSAWAQATAVCPECQVEPTTPCHDQGRARGTVHARRYTEAQETAA
jgi:hypothetical protein